MWTVGSWQVLCHIPRNYSKMEHTRHLAECVGWHTLCWQGTCPLGEEVQDFPLAFLTTITWWPLGPHISDEASGLSTSHQGECWPMVSLHTYTAPRDKDEGRRFKVKVKHDHIPCSHSTRHGWVAMDLRSQDHGRVGADHCCSDQVNWTHSHPGDRGSAGPGAISSGIVHTPTGFVCR